MKKPWSLYNKEDKLRVDDLTPEQVRIVLLATASKRMSHWYACQEGDVHWQPVEAIPEFHDDVHQIKGGPSDDDEVVSKVSAPAQPVIEKVPPVTNVVSRRPMFEEAPVEETSPTLQVDNTRTKERRTARRYPRRLGFRVALDGQNFNCETLDISMAGLSLEQSLPAWIPRTFSAELSLNKNSIKVMCTKVADNKLKLKDSSSWDVIRSWIVNW